MFDWLFMERRQNLITKKLQPYGIYIGSPAKLFSFRLKKNVIKQLLEINWWNWSFEKIKKNESFFDINLSNYTGILEDFIN